MQKQTAVVLFRGAVAMHFKYLDNFVRAIKRLDINPYVIFHANSKPPSAALDTIDSYEFFDLGSVPALRARVKQLCQELDVMRIYVFHDEDVYSACLCREDNQVVGLLPEQGIYFRDKNAMQQRALELGLKTPACCLPHTEMMVHAFVERYGYPFIVKPYNGFGCGNTFKVETPDQLRQVWRFIRNDRHNYRVEEYIQGTQFFIDSLYKDNQVVFDNLSQYTYNIIDYKQAGQYQGVITLGQGENDAHHRILSECRKVLSGFGLGTGVAHTEFYLSDTGDIYFGETAARCGGGPIISLLGYAYGFDLVEQWVRLDLNARVELGHVPLACFAAEYLSTHQQGLIKAISETDDIRRLPDVVEADVWAKPGDVIADAEHCYEVLGYYVCKAKDVAAAQSLMAATRARFSVTVV